MVFCSFWPKNSFSALKLWAEKDYIPQSNSKTQVVSPFHHHDELKKIYILQYYLNLQVVSHKLVHQNFQLIHQSPTIF